MRIYHRGHKGRNAEITEKKEAREKTSERREKDEKKRINAEVTEGRRVNGEVGEGEGRGRKGRESTPPSNDESGAPEFKIKVKRDVKIKRNGKIKRNVKIRTLENEGCGTRRKAGVRS